MIKILGNDGWYYFNINKVCGFNFNLNNLYIEVYLECKTVAFYVKDQRDIVDFVNIIDKGFYGDSEHR